MSLLPRDTGRGARRDVWEGGRKGSGVKCLGWKERERGESLGREGERKVTLGEVGREERQKGWKNQHVK